MNTAIILLIVCFFIIIFSGLRDWIAVNDVDKYLPTELFNAEWDEENKVYFLQVKRKWSIKYRTCYWEIEECDGNEYYRVTSKNANDLYKALDKKDEMVVFILWHCVPLKLSKDNVKKRY